MVHKILKIITIFLFLLFPFYPVLSAEPLSVVINEIAWMGTEANSSDEWIELYNNTDQDINLESWGLYEAGGEILIEPLTEVIKAKSYYLIERTDDTTISDIPASQEPTSWEGYGLKNDGEYLQLLDNNFQVIDEVNCSEGWFAGDNKTKKTMERINHSLSGNASSNWQTSQNSGGTPRAENSQIHQPSPELQPEAKTEPEAQTSEEQQNERKEKPTPISYPSGILINELVPSPEGKDELKEWLELKNINNEEIDISGWKIQDTVGSIKTYIFPEGTRIKAQGYLVLTRPVSKITLNNSDDKLELIQPNDNILDTVSYEKAPTEKSYSLIDNSWAWTDNLTPGFENIASSNPKLTEQNNKDEQENKGTIPNAENNEKQTIYLNRGNSGSRNFIIILIALFIATASGIIVLILKNKLSE